MLILENTLSEFLIKKHTPTINLVSNIPEITIPAYEKMDIDTGIIAKMDDEIDEIEYIPTPSADNAYIASVIDIEDRIMITIYNTTAEVLTIPTNTILFEILQYANIEIMQERFGKEATTQRYSLYNNDGVYIAQEKAGLISKLEYVSNGTLADNIILTLNPIILN